MLLQWSNETDKQSIEEMLRTSSFQTNAVQLALLEKKKFDEPSPEVYRDLGNLRQNHLLNMNREPTTKIAALLG